MSELMADDLSVIRSMYALSNDHSPALYQMNTGQILPGHPSMGSWITYGLGTENQKPACLRSLVPTGAAGLSEARRIGGNGYMPAAYQGDSVPLERGSDRRSASTRRASVRIGSASGSTCWVSLTPSI